MSMTTSAPDVVAVRPTPPTAYMNFIGGQWRASGSGRSTPNISPADTRVRLGDVPLSTADETADAIAAAKAAFPAWRAMPAPQRGAILFRALELLRERTDFLATILAWEEGKTFSESRGEVMKAANCLEFIAGEGRRLSGATPPSEMPKTFCYTVRQPLGVVGLITPWNFPVAIPVWKAAPALVSGNTVVWKPATLTPWTAQEVTRIFHDAGLPPGVLNLIYGSGGTVGTTIVDHPSVRAVSFTGSNEVGGEIYARGAKRLLKVQCEMGGKNPIVVFDDADVALAVESTAQGAFGSTGQRCTATSRAIVMENIADEFVERLVKRAGAVVVGDPLAQGVTMGPSVDESQMNTVLDYLEIGPTEGVAVRCGGSRLTDGAHAYGYYVAPTVFDHVTPEMRVAQEEIFGPVLSVIRVKTVDEAIEVANGVAFGLSSSVYSNDVGRVFEFLDKIETGITHVNSPTVGGEAQLPFGGMKGTGVGPREQGTTAIEFFTEIKTAYIDYTGTKRETNIY